MLEGRTEKLHCGSMCFAVCTSNAEAKSDQHRTEDNAAAMLAAAESWREAT